MSVYFVDEVLAAELVFVVVALLSGGQTNYRMETLSNPNPSQWQYIIPIVMLLCHAFVGRRIAQLVEQAAHVLGLGFPAEDPELYPAFDHLPVSSPLSPPSTLSPQ